MADFFRSLVELVRLYFKKRTNCYSIAAFLVLAFLGFQGIKLVSPWLKFELTLLGADSGPGALVVTLIAVSLIVAQFLWERRAPILLAEFKEALRLRELGYSDREIEAKSSVDSTLARAIYAAIAGHSVPIPIQNWTLDKLRSVVGEKEFCELLYQMAPNLTSPASTVGSLYKSFLDDPAFMHQFESIEDVIRWIVTSDCSRP